MKSPVVLRGFQFIWFHIIFSHDKGKGEAFRFHIRIRPVEGGIDLVGPVWKVLPFDPHDIKHGKGNGTHKLVLGLVRRPPWLAAKGDDEEQRDL